MLIHIKHLYIHTHILVYILYILYIPLPHPVSLRLMYNKMRLAGLENNIGYGTDQTNNYLTSRECRFNLA